MVNNLEDINGIGPKKKELLNKLGIYTPYDLINYYPYRYDLIKRTDIKTVNDGDKVIIDGIVEGQPTIISISFKLKKIIFRVGNKRNIYNITIYNQYNLFKEIKPGKEVTIFGKYNKVKNCIIANEIKFSLLSDEAKIEPVYFTTKGLNRKEIALFIKDYLETNPSNESYLPNYIVEKYNFMTKDEALQNIHYPKDVLSLKRARQRLKYEELFMYLIKIQYLKNKNKESDKCMLKKIDKRKVNKFINSLSFKLTEDQLKCIEDIELDFTAKKRMNRLVQGDVGSGKTIIAFIAAYMNYLAGYQTAMMAPTEILAKQHYENALKLFEKFDLNIGLLTSSTKAKEKKELYKKLNNGEIDLIIGTQSLIQEKIEYNNLGLAITDEQHRFGVNQRTSLKNKGIYVDILSMSATPIPRTYALTIYSDMDVSNVKTKPSGRKDIITYYKKETDNEILGVLKLMKQELDLNHQIYVICPSINESNNSTDDIEQKMHKAFKNYAKIGVVHGKLDNEEKENIMRDFETNKINILISTTVIEVGVNVPNASMIVIFNANLFGLSTLHQLRGRVGRGDTQSYCVLLSKKHEEKLKMLETCKDGFEISEYDFKERGSGDLFGVRQSGEDGLILANLKKDFQLLLRVKEDVESFSQELFTEEENIFNNQYKNLIEKLDSYGTLD